MSRLRQKFFVFLIVLLAGYAELSAQSTFSTYSIIGVGDYIDPAVPAAMGMGGLGISNGSPWYLNNTNPALLYYNQMALFSAGVLAETKTINQNGFEPYRSGTGNLSHVAVAYPLKRNKWSFSLGLQPLTSVNYSFFYTVDLNDPADTSTAVILNEGDGGITSLNFSIGGKIVKGLSVGLKASYLFSSYEKQYSSVIDATIPTYVAQYTFRQSVNDFNFGFGIAYQHKIGEYKINLGGIYELQNDVNGKAFARLEQRNLSRTLLFSDTLINNSDNVLSLPATIGAGISFGKGDNWVIGFDYKSQDWSKLRNDEDQSSGPDSFTVGQKFILGGEFTASPLDVRSYLKRITWRAGVTYEEKPYILSNKQITEFGINFGWTLPVSRFSSLDFGVMVGNRGTTEQNLVKENFFKVYFGATFNDNRWFIRPKFN